MYEAIDAIDLFIKRAAPYLIGWTFVFVFVSYAIMCAMLGYVWREVRPKLRRWVRARLGER